MRHIPLIIPSQNVSKFISSVKKEKSQQAEVVRAPQKDASLSLIGICILEFSGENEL